jgi:hypothetical protein
MNTSVNPVHNALVGPSLFDPSFARAPPSAHAGPPPRSVFLRSSPHADRYLKQDRTYMWWEAFEHMQKMLNRK